MNRDARKRHMSDRVMPVMAELFAAYDGPRYATFGCRTCHGDDARARDYQMPNPTLPLLFPTGTPEQQRTVAEHREMARFMFNAVTPWMRTMLGAPRFDTQTGEGFGCFSCHPKGTTAG